MAKYRFKTKEEFIRDGEWDHKDNRPFGWNGAGGMNHFLGQDIPEKYNSKCNNALSILIDDWHFASTNYVLKETKPVNRYTDFVFIPGNIYVGEWGSRRVIFKPSTPCLDDPCYIIKSTNEFKFSKYGCCSSSGVSFREANQEEKDWLEACIKANATVPRPSNSIPEYVECIESLENATVGKIYKVIDSTRCESDIPNYDYFWQEREFKPSTKEAYDAQNAPVVDTPTFEVGKWYKYNNWYIKYKKHDNGFWTSSEEIDDNKNYRECQSSFGKSSDHQKILLTDLSEIQPYLPDGHPDKFVEQKMFKKGDYIVYLSEGTHLLLQNYCYKQSQDENYLRVEKDASGVKNSWPLSGRYDLSHNWRYATPEEIKEYDRLGKPYDVTTLFQKKAEQKSFPQYVRLISDKDGEVYRVIDWTQHAYCVIESKSGKRLKPFKDLVSEAQEHEYYAVKPPKEMKKTIDFKSLEYSEWLEETKKLNLSLHDLQQHVNNGDKCDFKNVYSRIPGDNYKQKGKYLFNLWNSEKQPSIPQYVKCINGYGNALVGKIYRTDDEYQAKTLFGMTWEQVLIKYNHLGTKFIPATYLEYSEYHSEKAEQSKPSTDGGYPIKKETLIEDVHSVSVMLCTKNKSKQFKF